VVAALLDLAMQRVTPDPVPGLQRQARDLGLEKELNKAFETLAPTGWTLREQQLAEITKRLQEVAAARLVIPFRTAPADVLPPGFTIATQVGNDARVNIRRNGIMVAVGPPNAGKTTLLNHAVVVAREEGAHALIYDLKRDTTAIALRDEDFLIIDGDSPVNFLEIPPWEKEKEFVANFVEWWGRGQFSGQQQSQVVHEALTNALDQREQPCLADLKVAVDKMDTKNATYARRDAVQGVSRRLQRIKDQYRVPFNTRDGVPLTLQLDRSIEQVADAHNEISEWVFTYYYVHHAFTRNRAQQRRSGLTHVVIMDESLFSVSKEHAATKFGGMNLMAYLATLLREYAISLWVTGIHYESIDPLITKAAATTVLLPGLTDTQSLAWHLALTKEECAYINHSLQLGQGVFKLHGPWRHAILATFPPLTLDKTVDTNGKEWLDARARLAALLPDKQPAVPKPETVDPPTPTEDTENTAVDESDQSVTRGMSAQQRRYVTRICTGPLRLVSHLCKELGLHYEEGHRLKAWALREELIETISIPVGRGRGRRGLLVAPLPNAFAVLDLPVRKWSRGGGPIHSYYCQEIARILTATRSTRSP
jgi:energy-coupling factor transporter ATP-binding protein EcfA2